MSYMFSGCSSLEDIKISNFNTDNLFFIHGMFSRCSNELKMKMKNRNKTLDNEAYSNID